MPQPQAAASRDTKLARLEAALGAVLRGKPEVVRMSTVCLIARGHLLIEDVPGVGKTTLAQALARSVDCGFHRLQCTSDMLPGDILGVTVYNTKSGEFEFKPGPIFTNFLLADEINRATPKTQSALLEAMNERQITVDAKTLLLAQPFLVIATQNPVEHHGTYPLPESQLDRFLMRLKVGYPDPASERDIIRNHALERASQMQPVLTRDELLQLQSAVEQIRVDDALVTYMLSIVDETRRHGQLALGVSPRAAQSLYRASQALAMVEERDYVIPDDIKRLAVPIFAHRVVMHQRSGLAARSSEAAERVIEEILNRIEVPL
ncbi:MAG: ATPase [Candidatus Solibacter sp.]|nr:ATPase [Candidatus Solibacter sp.]